MRCNYEFVIHINNLYNIFFYLFLFITIFKYTRSYGVGICIRNHVGEFILAMTVHQVGLPSVHEAEAVGLLEAANWLN